MAEVSLQPDFQDLFAAFQEAGVEFLLVGGWALAAHGHGRGTDDLDLFVRASPENAERVFSALVAFGAPVAAHGIDSGLFSREGYGYRMGIKPNLIEILTAIDGVAFEDAWSDRKTVVLSEVRVPVLSRRALLANKRASGRPKDLADVAWLERNHSMLETEKSSEKG